MIQFGWLFEEYENWLTFYYYYEIFARILRTKVNQSEILWTAIKSAYFGANHFKLLLMLLKPQAAVSFLQIETK